MCRCRVTDSLPRTLQLGEGVYQSSLHDGATQLTDSRGRQANTDLVLSQTSLGNADLTGMGIGGQGHVVRWFCNVGAVLAHQQADLGWSGWDMGDSALLHVCRPPAGQTGRVLTAGSKEEAKIPTPAPPVLCKPLHQSHLHPIS